MKFLIVAVATIACAFAAPSGYGYSPYAHGPAAPLTPSGQVAETPEVVQAKAAHFAEHAKRGNYVAAPIYAPYAAVPAYAPAYVAPAPVAVLPSGFLADTPEVAHAKAAHLAEKAKVAAPAYAPYVAPYAAPYAGAYAHAPAQISVLPSGFLADTPEVAHAKASHFAEKSKAAAAAAASPAYEGYEGAYAYAAPSAYAGAYAGPYATPIVTPGGFLADTPEVAHAKAAHLAIKSAVSHY